LSRQPGTMRHDAQAILEMESCADATAVERMAHRWHLDPGAAGEPDVLLAPRFARVPSLHIPSPDQTKDHEVLVTGWSVPGWFTHLRVSYPGAPFPITVAHPTACGRPGYEKSVLGLGERRLWTAYALTLPAGTPYVEISKGEEMEARLVAVEFCPCEGPSAQLDRREPHASPVVAGIVDSGGLNAETLQAYDTEMVADFYRQMRAMGFTHILLQVYAGSALWSDVARPYRIAPFGHRSYANWNEPAKSEMGVVDGLQREIDRVRDAGLKVVASFRINNEWMADWARDMMHTDGIPDGASVLSVERRDLWMTLKSGGRYGAGLDFAFPEVRDYRLNIITEWCEKFRDFDGVCVDLYRHPPMVSYPEHLVKAFKEQTGIDVRTVEPIEEETMLPEWHAFRAAPFTEFMRSVRLMLSERCGDEVLLTSRVANSYERAMFDGADLDMWFRDGIVDEVVIQHRSPANPLEQDSSQIVSAAHEGGVRVVHLLGGWDGVDFDAPDLSPLRPLLANWRDWGSDGFAFYEAERIGRDGRWLREMPTIINAWQGGSSLA